MPKTKGINRKRLAYLAIKLVENAMNPKGAKFDLNRWYRGINKKKPISCGTTACAFGFAALLPAFKKQGLFIHASSPAIQVSKKVAERDFIHCSRYEGKYVLTGVNAAAYFFNIPNRDAQNLFLSEAYVGLPISGAAGEMAVATKIVALLNRPEA